MAALRLTSRERAEVYRQIFLLNRTFDLIVQRLDDLARTRIFSVRDMREVSGLAQEVQLEINTTLLSPLDSLEHDDWGTFGKVRAAMEKRLRDLTTFSFMRKNEERSLPKGPEVSPQIKSLPAARLARWGSKISATAI